MTKDKEQVFKDVKILSDRFRVSCANCPSEGGRNVVPLVYVMEYLTKVRELLGGHVCADAPELNFANLVLKDPISFPPGEYPPVSFKGTTLSDATFNSITFTGNFNFEEAGDSNGMVNFNGVNFRGLASFSNARLGKGVFCDLTFHDEVNLNSVQIKEIKNVRFIGDAMLRNAAVERLIDSTFEKAFVMNNMIFGKFLIENCKFSGLAVFNDSHFVRLLCKQSRFVNDVNFSKTDFKGTVGFEDVVFDGSSNFNDSKFADSTYFRRCQFGKPPTFYGATLYADTSFYTSKFSSFESEADWSAYRELRHIARSVIKSPAEEGRFFAYEQRTHASIDIKQRGTRVAGALSKMYDFGSSYGQNVVRPLLLLLGTNLVAGYLFWVLPCGVSANSTSLNLDPVVGFTLQNIFNPFMFFGKQTAFVPTNLLSVILAVSQSLFTIAFFALWLLAVRRRLRKDSE